MNRSRLVPLSLLIAPLALCASLASAKDDPKSKPKPKPKPAPVSATPAPETAPLGETALPPGTDPEALVTLHDALVLALRNNIDVELARVEPELAAEEVRHAKGAFDPVASLGYNFNHDENPLASSFQSSSVVGSDGWNYNAGVNGILPFGLRYQSGYQMNRDESDAQSSLLVREFRGGWTSSITMPLMRDFRMNLQKVNVVRSEFGQRVSREVFEDKLTGLIVGVENLYWDLAATRAQVNVAKKSLKTAQDLLEQTRVQQQVGVVSRVAVTQAEAGVAERELAAIQADNLAAAAKDKLLNALLAPNARAYQDRDVIPEAPTFADYRVDLEQALDNAMKYRPDLAQARTNVESAEVEEDFAGNQLRPRLDLVAGYTMSGLSGKSKAIGDTLRAPDECRDADPSNDAICSQPATSVSGDSWDSFRNFFHAGGAKGYSAGAKFELALGNRVARANASQRTIEARRARAQLRRVEQTVILNVRDAARGVESAAKAVGAAERRRAAATETLRAEQERLRLGDSTPFQVLQFEEDLAEAERQVIEALRSHRNAITRVEEAQGTLLTTRGIDVEDELH